MEIGLFVPIGNGNTTAEVMRTLGREAEGRGFESVWLPEHVVLFDDYESSYPYSEDGAFPGGADIGMIDPLSGLTYLAAVTDTLRLGTSICLVPQRNPVYTARQVADIDALSGGRMEFGVGIGWLREEFDALNVDWSRRGKRADEHVQVMKSLWTDDVSEFHGEMYDLPPARMYPKPVQSPHPPIHVGGESDAALRRVARLGQGWFTFDRYAADLAEPLDRLEGFLGEEGRRREDVTLTVSPYFKPVGAKEIEDYAAAGVDRLVVVCLAFDVDTLRSQLDQLEADVLDPARALG